MLQFYRANATVLSICCMQNHIRDHLLPTAVFVYVISKLLSPDSDILCCAANRSAWASHKGQQTGPQLWPLWVLTASCRAAASPVRAAKPECWICLAPVMCVALL